MESLREQLQEALAEERAATVTEDAATEEAEELQAVDEDQVDAEQGETDGENDREVRLLTDLAEALEWEPEDLYSLEVAMPGEESPIAIGELKNTAIDARRERDELAKRMQDQQQQMAQMQQMLQGQQGQDAVIAQMQGQYKVLEGYLSSPELAELKKADPGGAALRVQEVQQSLQNIQNQMGQYQQQQAMMQQQMLQQSLYEGQQFLRQQIPEWSNPEVEKAEKQEVTQVFLSAGYTPEQVSQITDPKAVLLARELAQLRKLNNAGKKAALKVRQSPKRTLKGGRMVDVDKSQKLVDRAMKTRSKGDILAAARALTGVRR